MKKKKILHIQKVLGICGSERHLLALLPRLNPARFEVTFLVLEDPRFPMNDYFSLFEGSGIRVEKMPIRHDVDPLLFVRLKKYIYAGEFDLVHTHLIHGTIYGNFAAKTAGVKRIICTRHDCSPYMENYFYRFLVRSSSRLCKKIIVISKAIGDFVVRTENIPQEKIVPILYGLDLPEEIYSPSPQELRHRFGVEDHMPVLAAVGRLVTSKGHRTLIESLPIVLKEVGETTLLIAGSGPLEGDLKKLARKLGVEERVRFLGFLNDVDPLYRTIDLLVHPSLREGFGLTVLEAMGHGLPVIASRVTALPEIVEDGKTGILVAPQNTQALAEAIIRILKDKPLRMKMGAAGLRRMTEHFLLDRMVRETEELYDEILLGKGESL